MEFEARVRQKRESVRNAVKATTRTEHPGKMDLSLLQWRVPLINKRTGLPKSSKLVTGSSLPIQPL
eukprot:1795980-Amphidinium_carterae.1